MMLTLNLCFGAWVKIDSVDPTINFSTTINVLEDSIKETASSSFVVIASKKKETYDIWLSVSSSNWDSNTNYPFASLIYNGKTYKLPLDINLYGITKKGIEVDTSITQNMNNRPTGSTLTGNRIWGTRKKKGDTFNISVKVNKNIIGVNNYVDFPVGIYTLNINLNVVLDKD